MKKILSAIIATLLVIPAAMSAQEVRHLSDTTGVSVDTTSKVVLPADLQLPDPEFKMLDFDEPESETTRQLREFHERLIQVDLANHSTYYENEDNQPMIRDYQRSGSLGTWNGIHFVAGSAYHEHPFLLTSRSAAFGLGYSYGPLSVAGGVMATNYTGMPLVNFNQFGIYGNVTYRISDFASATIFGQFYNAVPLISMSAYPYIDTSRFGGYMSFDGDNVGIDLGVQRYFDPIRRTWETAPIITPKVKLWDSVTVELPMGGLVKNAVDRAHGRDPYMPPPPPRR